MRFAGLADMTFFGKPFASPRVILLGGFPLCALFLVLVFHPLLRAPFLYDDHSVIESDPAIVASELTYEDGEAPHPVEIFDGLWTKPRPLRQLTHRLEWRFLREAPGFAHGVNLLLHLAVAALAFCLMRMWKTPPSTALCAISIFLFNPVVVESLGIVSHRKEMLSAIFLLAGLIAATRLPQHVSPLALIAFFLAAAGKETAILAPAFLLLFAFSQGESARGKTFWRSFTVYFLFAVFLAFFFRWQIHLGMADFGHNPGEAPARAGHYTIGTSWPVAFSAAVRALPRHLLLTALPLGHSLDPAFPLSIAPFSPPFFASLALDAAALAGLALLWRKDRRLALPATWILLGLLPYLSPTLIRQGATALLADRYLYLPSIGFAWLVSELLSRVPGKVAHPLVAIIIVIFMGCSWKLSTHYHSECELWEFTSQTNPRSLLAAHNHAWALWKDREDFSGAASEFERMMRIDSGFDYGICSYAQLHAQENDFDSALELLDSAIPKMPKSMALHRQRALIRLLAGKNKGALADFKKAASLGADDPAFHRGYAELLTHLMMWGEAEGHLQLAAKNPAFEQDARDSFWLSHNPPLLVGDVLVVGDSVPHGTSAMDKEGKEHSLASLLDEIVKPAPRIRKPIRFLDLSVPGSLAEDARQALVKAFAEHPEPSVCIIMTGVNDAFAGKRPAGIVRELAEIVLTCRKAGGYPILIGPIPVHSVQNRDRKAQEAILLATNNLLRRFCASAQVQWIDSRAVLACDAPHEDNPWIDHETGNHLTLEGLSRIADAISEMLRKPPFWFFQ